MIKELVVKDIKIRYSHSLLQFFWAFLSPLLIVLILYLVFGVILKVRIDEAPFLLYLMTAVFIWRFFQDSLVCSTTSLIDNKHMIRESNFPHYLIPVSIVLSFAINLIASLVILMIVSLLVLGELPFLVLLLPLVLIIHLSLATGLSIIFSIWYIKWRDIKHILDAALLLMFYLTPAFYSVFQVKSTFSPILFRMYMYNPLVAILNLYRFTLLEGFYKTMQKEMSLSSLIVIPSCFCLIVLWYGFRLYNKNKIINDYLSY